MEREDYLRQYVDLTVKMSAMEEFKPGNLEYNKMSNLINKFVGELDLYKKISEKYERDIKKKDIEFSA